MVVLYQDDYRFNLLLAREFGGGYPAKVCRASRRAAARHTNKQASTRRTPMAQMLFYDNIVALNRERHADLRLKPANGDCSFAAGSHFVPLAGTEFYEAGVDYPIMFAGDENEPTPVALLGLREGHNAFVNADGRWRNGTYVPAFVRRYPFVLARGEQAGDEGNLAVCVDESYQGFTREQGEGEALFDGEGKQTPMLEKSVGFLQQYLAESERTRTFVKRLLELDLLVRRDMRITDSEGNSYVLRDFRVIESKKLNELDEASVVELHKNGFLGWIHAHLVSMSRLERMPATVSQAA